MFCSLVKRIFFSKNDSIIVFDDCFPNVFSSFRIAEYNFYLEFYKNCTIFSSHSDFENLFSEYKKYYPKYYQRVLPFDSHRKYTASLGYTIFLNNAYKFLSIFEQYEIPFIFTLYPGGGFWLDQKESDEKLEAVCKSSFFRGMIVTQKNSRDYVLRKSFCLEDSMKFFYGGVLPTDYYARNCKQKKYYKDTKSTFDICFVAFKYMEQGRDKGYPIFIDVCTILLNHSKDFRFHVVGDFSEDDIDVSHMRDFIFFYGPRQREFFPVFYSAMDIILSPNIPYTLFPGSFDGFPTGAAIEAGLAGVAVFCTDELGLNSEFTDRQDICIISHNTHEIIEYILHYYKNIYALYELSRKGRKKFFQIFDIEHQMKRRIEFFKKYI